MGIGKRLTDVEIGQIEVLQKEGLNQSQISKRINRSRNVIQKYLKEKENYGTKKSPGRPRILSKRDERKVFLMVKQNNFNSTQITANLTNPPSS